MKRSIFLSSLVLTVLIFALGILLNYALDFVRIATIADVMAEHEVSTASYLIEQEFVNAFGGNKCDIMQRRVAKLKEEIRKVGGDLGSYSGFTWFKKQDYDYLKRKYFLLELKFLTLINQVNRDCNKPYVPILFFYAIDDDASERQGFILDDISKAYEQEVVVLSIDKDYADEPLVQLLVAQHNISTAPTLLIDGERFEGLAYGGQVNATVREFLRKADPYARGRDFSYVVSAAGRDREEMIANFTAMLAQTDDPFAKGDLLLVLGRLAHNDTVICASVDWYDRARENATPEERAVLWETVAAVHCGRNRRAFLLEAAREWRALGNAPRAALDEALARSGNIKLKFNVRTLEPALPSGSASAVIIGETGFVLNASSLVLTQADRVTRDWLGLQLSQSPQGKHVLRTMSERLWQNASELREDLGWHEGGRIHMLAQAGIPYRVATGTLAAELQGRWYAADDQGVFRFEVPLDKILYPTTRFLRDDLAVLVDTHGVNTLVEQAVRNNATHVLSDCDHPGKVAAAAYLSEQGISVSCFPDKFVYQALGHNLSLVGSPPIDVRGGVARIGSQPVTIQARERIVVMNATDWPYALWYYQTPASYFAVLQQAIPLDVAVVTVADFGQMGNVIAAARSHKAGVIGVRVFSSRDYAHVKQWLAESPEHRAVLFHSSSYPYGHSLLQEFPDRVTFDDPNPRFVQ